MVPGVVIISGPQQPSCARPGRVRDPAPHRRSLSFCCSCSYQTSQKASKKH